MQENNAHKRHKCFIDKSQKADAVKNAMTVMLINIVTFNTWFGYIERPSLLARKCIEFGISRKT